MPAIEDLLLIPQVVSAIATVLSSTDLRRCTLISQQMHRIWSPFLWSSLTLRDRPRAIATPKALLTTLARHGRHVHMLTVDGNATSILHHLFDIVQRCHTLTGIHISLRAMSPLASQSLYNLMAQEHLWNPALERVHLDLFGHRLNETQVLQSLSRLKYLTKLCYISGRGQPWSTSSLIHLLKYCRRLRTLHWRGMALAVDHDVEEYSRSDIVYLNLQELDLVHQGAPPTAASGANSHLVEFYLEVWRKSPDLQTLWLCGRTYPARHVDAMAIVLGRSKIRRLQFLNHPYSPQDLARLLSALPRGQLQRCELQSNTYAIAPEWLDQPQWGECLVQNHFAALVHVVLARGTTVDAGCHGWVPALFTSCPRLRAFKAPAFLGACQARQKQERHQPISLDICAAVQAEWVCLGLQELDIPIVGVCRKDDDYGGGGDDDDDSDDYDAGLVRGECKEEARVRGGHEQVCKAVRRQFFERLCQLREMRRFSMGYEEQQGPLVDTVAECMSAEECEQYTQSGDSLPWTLDDGLMLLETAWRRLEYLGLAWTAHGGALKELLWMVEHWPRLKHIDGFWRVCDYADDVESIFEMTIQYPDVKVVAIVPRCGTRHDEI